jgi:hypothetical protein
MRIRTIKPEFWSNEKLSALSESSHMFAAALLNYCDDEGYFNANPKLIKAALYPIREPSVNIHGMLTELSNIDYLRFGKGDDGRVYGVVVGFTEHQKINRPSPSKIKMLAKFTECSVIVHGQLPGGTGNREQGAGNGEQGTWGVGGMKNNCVKIAKKQTAEKRYSDDAYRVTEYFLNCILEHKPNLKRPNIETWTKEIDQAIRIDNRTPRELCEVARWATRDPFWMANILSTKKLRDKFDQLQAKMTTGPKTMEQHAAEWLALADDTEEC